MKTALFVATALGCCLTVSPALADQNDFTGGGALHSRQTLHVEHDADRLAARIDQAIADLGLERSAAAAADSFDRSTAERLHFPVRTAADYSDAQIHAPVNFVDLTGAGRGVRDSECGGRTYDGHQGIDYLAAPFWWSAMDDLSAEVVSAAPGTILLKVDGQNDRQCMVNESQDNLVVVLHDDGLVAIYRHLASGSLTTANVGDRVEAGDFIGIIGSSGSSTAPHLHFELQVYEEGRMGGGEVVDPNAGPCGASETLWRHQPAYYDADILSLRTHNLPPVINTYSSACNPDQPNLTDGFEPGQRGYWAVYLRNQRPGELVNLTVYEPDGDEFTSWDLGATLLSFQPFTYWYGSALLPEDAPEGEWRFRAEFEDRVIEQVFRVGGGDEEDEDTRLRASILPASRSVRAGSAATVFSTVINPGQVTARGCSIRAAEPFDGVFSFAETDPATNQVTGESDRLFDLAPGAARSFLVTAQPHAGAVAESLDLTLRYDCANSDAAPVVSGVNTIRMSFGPVLEPDMIAVAITGQQNGILSITDDRYRGAFAVATANVGAAGALTLRPEATGLAASSVALTICETNPSTGQCLGGRADVVQRTFAADETASFAIFAHAEGDIAFSPARNRVRVDIVDDEGVVRGATSVAIRTVPAPAG